MVSTEMRLHFYDCLTNISQVFMYWLNITLLNLIWKTSNYRSKLTGNRSCFNIGILLSILVETPFGTWMEGEKSDWNAWMVMCGVVRRHVSWFDQLILGELILELSFGTKIFQLDPINILSINNVMFGSISFVKIIWSPKWREFLW